MRRTDVLLVSALVAEHRAVVGALVDVDADVVSDGDAFVADIAGLRVVAASLATMGNVGAAAGAQLAIDMWHPRHVILVGIAAGADGTGSGSVGVPTGDPVRLGDVLVGETIVGYEPGKHHASGLQRRPDVYRAAFSLLNSARAVTPTEWGNVDDEAAGGAATVHVGTVLTGEKVLADGRALAELRRMWPAMVGVEMEGLGIATAAHRSGLGFLLVKGVSDLADEDKDDAHRDRAAGAAARFTVALLRRLASPPVAVPAEDTRRPVRAPTRRFALAMPDGSSRRIAVVAGSLYRTRGATIWVNSENTEMDMSRPNEFTVSGIIRYWGSRRDDTGRVLDDAIANELARKVGQRGPVAPGTAIATGPGALAESHGVRHVIHVASVAGEPGSGFRQVHNLAACVTNVLVEADRLARLDPAARTILFPLLGAGTGGGPIESTATTMVDTFVEFFFDHPDTPLAEVQVLGFNAAEWRAVTAILAADARLVRVDAA